MPKQKFSKAAFTEDIDSRIKQANAGAKKARRGTSNQKAQEAVEGELQRMRVSLIGSPLALDD